MSRGMVELQASSLSISGICVDLYMLALEMQASDQPVKLTKMHLSNVQLAMSSCRLHLDILVT